MITGQPGAGKSAILARYAVGHPDVIAIHAKNKTFEDIRERIAQRLNVEPKTESIFNYLKAAPQTVHFVLDALDEAVQPGEIGAQILSPMNDIPMVRMAVGDQKFSDRRLPARKCNRHRPTGIRQGGRS